LPLNCAQVNGDRVEASNVKDRVLKRFFMDALPTPHGEGLM
jgi:hypothetical protein